MGRCLPGCAGPRRWQCSIAWDALRGAFNFARECLATKLESNCRVSSLGSSGTPYTRMPHSRDRLSEASCLSLICLISDRQVFSSEDRSCKIMIPWSIMLHFTACKCSVWHQSVCTSSKSRLWMKSSTCPSDLRGEPGWGMKASRQVAWPGKPNAVFQYWAASPLAPAEHASCIIGPHRTVSKDKEAGTVRNGVGSEWH